MTTRTLPSRIEQAAAELANIEGALPDFDPVVDPTVQPWRGILAIEGQATSDGRIFDKAVWRELPLCLLWQRENNPGHDGAVVVGRIDRIVRRGAELWGMGVFDLGSEHGKEVVRLFEGQFLRGVSIDAAVGDGEVTVGEDGTTRFSQVEIGAATVVAFPAFANAELELTDEPVSDATEEAALEPLVEPVVASAAVAPPREWFTDPQLTQRRGLHVEADGRIWGHLYGWGECHQGNPRTCITVPRGGSYAHITSVDGRGVLTADGSLVQTGPIFVSADHAALRGISWLQAKDHYAHTGLAVADVCCGEDSYGIWVAGYVRPGTPDELVATLRASGPSGDWRRIGGRMELVAILSVNKQGFPALAASFAGGEVESLVAASSFAESDCGCGGTASSELLSGVLSKLGNLESAVDEMMAPVRAQRDAEIVALERAIGLDAESVIARLEADLVATLGPPKPACYASRNFTQVRVGRVTEIPT